MAQTSRAKNPGLVSQLGNPSIQPVHQRLAQLGKSQATGLQAPPGGPATGPTGTGAGGPAQPPPAPGQ